MKGHPVRGAVAGLLFGVFLVVDAHITGLWSISTASEIVLPAAGLLLGLLLAAVAPFGKTRSDAELPD